jgi:hypothetical protein
VAAYSEGLTLVWSVAAGEAAQGGAADINPGHLMVACCKFATLGKADLTDAIPNAPADAIERTAE